jgi:hypothetical protein
VWPWCNLATSQRRSYCTSVNNHSPVGLVTQQWDIIDWDCVLCDRRIQNERASRSASSRQRAFPFYSSCAEVFFLAKHHITQVCEPPYSLYLAPCDFWLFPKLKSPLKRRRFVNATVHSPQAQSTASLCRLSSPTGEWLAVTLYQGHATDSRDIQNGRILSRQTSYILIFKIIHILLHNHLLLGD